MEMEKSNCLVLRSHTTWPVGLSIQVLLDSMVIVGFPVLYKVLYSQDFKGRQPALLKEVIQTYFINGQG